MGTETVVWTKVGKFEHNLPEGVHVIYGSEVNTKTVTEKDLAALEKRGCKHVRKAEKLETKIKSEKTQD